MIGYHGYAKYQEMVRKGALREGDKILTFDSKKRAYVDCKVLDEERIVRGALFYRVKEFLYRTYWNIDRQSSV